MRRWSWALAALTVGAVVATPEASVPGSLVVLGLGALGLGWAPAAPLGVAAAWALAVGGTLGPAVLGVAVLALGLAAGPSEPGPGRGGAWPRRLGLGVGAVAGVEALRQLAAASVLPGAAAAVDGLLLAGLAAGGAMEATRVARPGIVAAGALLAGLVGVGRLVDLPVEAGARARRAAALGAPACMVGETGESPLARERARLERVRLWTGDDAAALEGDPARALDAGWRPHRACPTDPRPAAVPLPRPRATGPCAAGPDAALAVARALDTRGRGGEGLRLLGRHPREGRLDWEMALLEEAQGVPSRWRGWVAPEAAVLPGALDWPAELLGNATLTREVVAAGPIRELRVTGVGTAYEGPPTVAVRAGRRALGRCAFDGVATCALAVDLPAGPHRLEVAYDSDRVGPAGDRNLRLVRVEGR